MDHCSSEGATVGIQSSLFKTKISVQNKNFKTRNNFSSISNKFQNSLSILHQIQFQIKIHFNFISKSISKITIQNSFQFILKIKTKLSENIELSYVWDYTISNILLHDLDSKMGNMIKEWVVFIKLEDFNSFLKYTDDDFTPTGTLCYIN